MAKPDFYVVLGVPRSADAAAIKRGYREQALLHHPDKNPDCVDKATERFKLIAEAYSVLQDPQKKAAYDNRGCRSTTTVRFQSQHYDDDDDYDDEDEFSIHKAKDLFREVFGDELTTKLVTAAEKISPHLTRAGSVVSEGLEKVAEGAAPHVKAAASATVSGLTVAAERCGKTRIVRGAVAAHLSSLTDDAIAYSASMAREEVIHRNSWEESVKALQDHEQQVALMLESRNERRVGWWKALKEWVTQEQQEADERSDRQAAAKAQQLRKRVRANEMAWRQSTRVLADAEAAASRAQLQEDDVVRNGASLGDAAMVGMHYLTRFVERIPSPVMITS